MRLLPLVALVLLVLIIVMVIRARRISRLRKAEEQGWFAQKIDIGEETVIKLAHIGKPGRLEAKIPFNDPNYSDRVIEEFARVEVKAADWNSTNKALNVQSS
jgi:hypothetical protein